MSRRLNRVLSLRLLCHPRVQTPPHICRIGATPFGVNKRVGRAPSGSDLQLLSHSCEPWMHAQDDVAWKGLDLRDAPPKLLNHAWPAPIARKSEVVARDRVQAVRIHHVQTAITLTGAPRS